VKNVHLKIVKNVPLKKPNAQNVILGTQKLLINVTKILPTVKLKPLTNVQNVMLSGSNQLMKRLVTLVPLNVMHVQWKENVPQINVKLELSSKTKNVLIAQLIVKHVLMPLLVNLVKILKQVLIKKDQYQNMLMMLVNVTKKITYNVIQLEAKFLQK
jgi:hypothetical protein